MTQPPKDPSKKKAKPRSLREALLSITSYEEYEEERKQRNMEFKGGVSLDFPGMRPAVRPAPPPEVKVDPQPPTPEEIRREQTTKELASKGVELGRVPDTLVPGTTYVTPADLHESGYTKYSPKQIIKFIQSGRIPGWTVAGRAILSLDGVAKLKELEEESVQRTTAGRRPGT